MRIYSFGVEVGRSLADLHADEPGLHVSGVNISPIAGGHEDLRLACMHFAPGGVIGRHPAITPQLFLVTQGEGMVSGEGDVLLPISAGQAAFWEPGEQHESRSESGMTAIVVELPRLDLFMPELGV